jgi:ribose 5-phosphate isomerase A
MREGRGVEFNVDQEKKMAAVSAVDYLDDGMTVGLGTGSTVAYLIPAIAYRELDITCVATSPDTENLAISHGLRVVPFDQLERLDVAIDGADQVDPHGWLVKGGGGAHTREKIVASAAERFIVIVSANKLVGRLRPPVPLELLPFGLHSTLRWLMGDVRIRSDTLRTPDGGILADWYGEVDDLAGLGKHFSSTPGVISHGLFQPDLTERVLIGRGTQVDVMKVTPPD